jgi:GTP cyclohydrolase I
MNKKIIEENVASILTEVGINLNQPDFQETPKRVAKLYEDLFSGVNHKEEQVEEILSKWFPSTVDEMIVFHNHAFSLCPHHLLPVEYDVYTAYLPKERVIGLSKIGRLITLLAKKPIIQENLTVGISKAIMKYLKPLGCATMIKGRHSCMTMRGVKQVDSKVITSNLQGGFVDNPSAKQEFLEFIKLLK